MNAGAGPLAQLRVVEFAGIGPAPFAAMLLADMGAEVLQIDKVAGREWPELPIVSRGRATIRLDLKSATDLATCQSAVDHADILIEGFRPGVMERLGLGPDDALQRNPRLIYGRITGWGQTGPLARSAGHDINYLALSGVLSLLGDPDTPPVPPINLLGDYAGGSLYLIKGILAALYERSRSGLGQVVDAAIVDGVASLMSPILGMEAAGIINLDRAGNMLGGARAPHYRCYLCADGRHVAVGPLEPRFRSLLCEKLGLPTHALDEANDPDHFAEISALMAEIFATRSRDEWAAKFQGSDCCVSPVLSPEEAWEHPQLGGRGSIVKRDGSLQPAPAPRLSRTPEVTAVSPLTGEHRLAKWLSA